MTQSKIEEVLFNISTTLSKIETKLTGVCEVLSQHEHRITNLEANKVGFKDNIVRYLCIALISSLAVIATLTGSTAILSQIFGGLENDNGTNHEVRQEQAH